MFIANGPLKIAFSPSPPPREERVGERRPFARSAVPFLNPLTRARHPRPRVTAKRTFSDLRDLL